MSRRFLWVIAIFMAIAMVCLIIVQAYWINNAIEVKEKQFSQIVNRILSNIVYEVQNYEAMLYIVDEMDLVDSNIAWSGITHFDITLDGDKYFEEVHVKSHEQRISKQGLEQVYIYEHSSSTGDQQNFTIIAEDTFLNAEIGKVIIDTSGPERAILINPQTIQKKIKSKISDNRLFIDNVISRMMTPDVGLEERINPTTLNKMIQRELYNNGIFLDYEFAILKENLDVAVSSDEYDAESNVDYFETELFPRDLFRRPSYLSVYFPKKTNFLLRSLGFMAISSILLTMVIILSFSFIIYIIFKQKRLSEIKNDFVNNMTHELKTPISTISLASQMLNDQSIPEKRKNLGHISKVIEDESKRLGYQVEKVLQMAIFDKGRIKLKLKKVDMNELIQSVSNNFAIQLNNKNGQIIEELNATQAELKIDAVHFTNVISNLIDNAIKYSDKDPVIHIGTQNVNSKLLIRVKDNGIGIKKEDQKRIFEKFYRVPMGNVHNVKGFGLGLSYVKKIVEEHHGTVKMKSEPGSGTEFEICLPLNDNFKK